MSGLSTLVKIKPERFHYEEKEMQKYKLPASLHPNKNTQIDR